MPEKLYIADEVKVAKISGDSLNSSERQGDNKKQQFSGTCSFVVSLVGYSMGNSDFWRFPYLVYRNGGGAFLIPFATTMLICGISLMFLELSLSQFSGKGPVNVWQMSPFFKGFVVAGSLGVHVTNGGSGGIKTTARPELPYPWVSQGPNLRTRFLGGERIGYSLLAINMLTSVYSNILRGWIIEYLVNTFRTELPWKNCDHSWNRPGCIVIGATRNNTNTANISLGVQSNITQMTAAEQFWQYEVLKLSPGLDDLGGMMWNMVLYVFLWRLFITLCMLKSIKSIEKVMFVTVFLPIALMLAVWVRSLLLDGSVSGMMYYLTPTFARITDVQVWLEAAIMACYTLGPAWGSVILIGSHNKFNSNCLRHSVITTVLDCISAVINGLICFSILGIMAHDSGLDIDKVVSSGLSLGFTVYPTAFTFFPMSQVWCGLFFVNLVLVGFDAQTISMETVVNCCEELLPKLFRGRRRTCLLIIINILAFLLSIPFCTQCGCYIFQLLDWYVLAWTLLFVSLVECIVFMWIYGGDRVNRDLIIMLGRPLPVVLRISGAFLIPVVLLTLLVISFARYKPPRYGSYHYPPYAEAVGWSIAIAIVLPIAIVFIWKLFTTKGSWNKKFASITKPSNNWGPNDSFHSKYYCAKGLPGRSLYTVFMCNLTGRDQSFKQTVRHQNGSPETSLILNTAHSTPGTK